MPQIPQTEWLARSWIRTWYASWLLTNCSLMISDLQVCHCNTCLDGCSLTKSCRWHCNHLLINHSLVDFSVSLDKLEVCRPLFRSKGLSTLVPRTTRHHVTIGDVRLVMYNMPTSHTCIMLAINLWSNKQLLPWSRGLHLRSRIQYVGVVRGVNWAPACAQLWSVLWEVGWQPQQQDAVMLLPCHPAINPHPPCINSICQARPCSLLLLFSVFPMPLMSLT